MARILSGRVVSTKMDKTAVVEVTRLKNHRLYGKKYKVTKKYFAHDPDNQAKVGQMVQISETVPISKRKRWQIATAKNGGAV